jgi:hypothetical protein
MNPVLSVDFRVGVDVGFGTAVGAGVSFGVSVGVGTFISLRGVNKPARFAGTALCLILTFHNASEFTSNISYTIIILKFTE